MDSFHPNDNVVSLSTAPNPALAHIWKNALREEDIHCQVVGDFLDAGLGDISGVQPQIWIERRDMTRARAVLRRCQQSVVDSRNQPSVLADAETTRVSKPGTEAGAVTRSRGSSRVEKCNVSVASVASHYRDNNRMFQSHGERGHRHGGSG